MLNVHIKALDVKNKICNQNRIILIVNKNKENWKRLTVLFLQMYWKVFIRLFHLRMFSQQETAANAFSPAMIFIYVAIKLFRAFHFHQCTKTECHLSCVPLSLWLFAFFLPSLLTFTHFIAFYLDHFYRLSYCDILTYRSASYTYACTWRGRYIIQLHFNAYKSFFLRQYHLKIKIVETVT